MNWEWVEVLRLSFDGLLKGTVMFIPKFIGALALFIFGWIVAAMLGEAVSKVISAFKVDKALKATGIEEPLAKAGFRLDTGAFIGALVRWFVIIVFLIASLEILGLTQINFFLESVVLDYLPRVVVATLILVIAAFLANIMQKIVVGSAKAAGVPSTNLLGGVTKWSIWIFATLAALYHLGIAGVFAQTLFTGLVAMLAIAGGLAFGLGGKEAAARYIEKLREDIK